MVEVAIPVRASTVSDLRLIDIATRRLCLFRFDLPVILCREFYDHLLLPAHDTFERSDIVYHTLFISFVAIDVIANEYPEQQVQDKQEINSFQLSLLLRYSALYASNCKSFK